MTLPHRHNWVPTFGCLVSQPPGLLTIPEPHQGAGEREIPLCLCVSVAGARAWEGGFRPQGPAQWHTFVLLQRAVVFLLAVGGGFCVRVPHHKAASGVCGSCDLRLPPAHD